MFNTFLLAMFYGPMIPIAFPITAMSLFAEYWLFKYLLMRRHTMPEKIGSELDQTMLKTIPIGSAILSVSSMIFHYNYNSDALIPCTVGLVATAITLLVPINRIREIRRDLEKMKEL
jgi:hypothetical protein